MTPTPADPGAIDLGLVGIQLKRGINLEAVCHDLIAAVEALRERVAGLKERIGGLCSYPLCNCKSKECLVLDGPIPEQEWRDELLSRAEAAEARVAELAGAVGGLVKNLDELIGESHGVDGLHLNGDVAPWDSLLADGEFPWLEALDPARAALAATPAEALERARARDVVVTVARSCVDRGYNGDPLVAALDAALAKLDALGKEGP